MSRLASFKGPSSPSSLSVRAQPPSTPPSPTRVSETTQHRKVRALLRELHTVAQTWDNLVLVDGLSAAQSLVDTRTELDNDLSFLPAKSIPPMGLVAPKIHLMEKRLGDLDSVLQKLQKQFTRMTFLVDTLESIVYEAHKTKGWKWVQEEPLWCTWTLERFATHIPAILPVYYRSLYQMREFVSDLHSHEVTFETSRDILSEWVHQPYLEAGGWSDWEDLCSVEVDRWDLGK